MRLYLSQLSTEYVHVPITPVVPADPVWFAFCADWVSPGPDEWTAGDWDAAGARILVGPAGAVALAPSPYIIWVRIDDNPEHPVRKAGVLVITED